MTSFAYIESAAPVWPPFLEELVQSGALVVFASRNQLFQDTGRVTPVASDGDPVGLALDASGLDKNAAQAAADKRPLWREDGSAAFDGLDDRLVLTGVHANTSSLTLVCGVRTTAASGRQEGIGVAGVMSSSARVGVNASGRASAGWRSTVVEPEEYDRDLSGNRVVLTTTYDADGSPVAGDPLVCLYVNDRLVCQRGGGFSGAIDTAKDFWIGALNNNGVFANGFCGRIFAAGVIDRVLSYEEIRQLSLFLGFDPDPDLPANTLPRLDAFWLPQVSGTSRFPVCTGLAMTADGTMFVGDDGRVIETDTAYDAGVNLYSADGKTELGRWSWSTFALPGAARLSCQGVALDANGTVYAVAKDTSNGRPNTVIVHFDPGDGSLIETFSATGDTNGLAIDYDNGHLLTLSDNSIFRRLDKATGEQVSAAGIADLVMPDHLHYLGGGKVILSSGANGAAGQADVFDISGAAPTLVSTHKLDRADAVEGVALHNGYLFVANDARFHGGNPNRNRVHRYLWPVTTT